MNNSFVKLGLSVTFALLPQMGWSYLDSSKPVVSENPFWIQVEDPKTQSESTPSTLSDFGFKFQKAVFQGSSTLPFSQPLFMGCVYYQSPFYWTGLSYQVSVWLGESPLRAVSSAQYLNPISLSSRFFGLEIGLEKSVWKLGSFTLIPGLALRSQLVTQMVRSSQLPTHESFMTLPNAYLGAEYFFNSSLGFEMILAHDNFFRTQFQLGVFRRW